MSTTTSAMPVNYQLSVTTCSQCSSMAHFQCLDHCKDVFCGKCSVKHRNEVMKRMDNLKEQLQLCKIDPVTTHDAIDENFYRASQETIRRTRSTVKNLISELEQRQATIIKEIEKGIELRAEERKRRTDSALLTSEEAVTYNDLLSSCVKNDQLLDADDIVNIQRRLDARNALGQSASEAKNPLIELGKFEPEKILRFRQAPRTESSFLRSKSANTITVTIRLGKHKQFKTPIEGAFSVGKHPTAISLNDRYLETFFLRRTPGNSLILLSTTAVDFVNRGSGVENSIRLSKILGTNKDKLLAGTWCENSQCLLLVGNHRMYLYDMQVHEHAKKFRCEPKEGDPVNSARFITCAHGGSIFYAFKSDANTYTVGKYRPPVYAPTDGEDKKHFFSPEKTAQINGRVAAMCHTHNRLAFVYQQFQSNEHVKHFFCLFDHNLSRSIETDVMLPNSIKWITAITSFGNDGQYLLCDPRGQQLLLYRTLDGILTRRFRIGALNACCLTDGKLVLWLQKQYASSPTGKLHFITAPHLEEPANVAKSLPLLTKK